MIPTIEQFISSAVDNYVVRPTGSPNKIGVGGFLFDIYENEEVSLDAEITDHYVEDNYAIQDHIALRPLMFTLRGYVAELRDLQSQSLMPSLSKIQSLAGIGGFAPKFTNQATQAYAQIAGAAAEADAIINQANNLFGIFASQNTSAVNQQKAYNFFFGLFQARQLCTVETPFQTFENMAISSLRAIQRGDTSIISDFAITFKQIRTTVSVDLQLPVLAGRAGSAMLESVSGGIVSGLEVDTSALTLLQGENFI